MQIDMFYPSRQIRRTSKNNKILQELDRMIALCPEVKNVHYYPSQYNDILEGIDPQYRPEFEHEIEYKGIKIIKAEGL